MKRFITVVIALLAISLLVSCGNLSLAGKNVNPPNKTGKGTIRIRVGDELSQVNRAVDIPTQSDVTEYQVAIYTSEEQEVVFSALDITPAEMAEGLTAEVAFGTYAVSVNALRGDEIIFRGVSRPVEITAADKNAVAEVQMYQILAVYDNGTVSTSCYWERLMTDEDAEHLNWFIPSVDDVDNDSWKISGKEVIGWKNTDTDLEYDAGDKIWLSGKTLPLHLEAIWAEPDTAEPIVKLIEFFTHDGSILSAEQESFAITSEELAEDGTFELPIEDLTESMEYWGRDYLPEGATFEGWKDADGTIWTLSDTMHVAALPAELPLKLYAQWDLPARVSYWFNFNWEEGYDNSEEFTEWEGAVISLDDILDYFGFDYPVYCEQTFIGCSVNKQFPVINSSNYDEIIAELKNTVVLKDGDSYELTDDTTFYVIWANYYSLSSANKIVKVNYRLGEAEDQITEDAQKTHYYLKDLMESYNDIENNTYYILPLPDVNEIFPQWDNAPVGTIKDDKWIYNNNRENPVSGEIDLTETDFYDWNCDIDIWSEIKVPIIQYWDGGTYYGGIEYSTDTIDPDRMENFVYYKSYPFPDSFDFDVWEPRIHDYKDSLFASSLSHNESLVWKFEKWKDKNTGYAYKPSSLNGGTWARFRYDEIHSFPLQLEACWTSPTEVAGYEATPIRTVEDFLSIFGNPSGTYSLECNLSLGDCDRAWPMGDFTGTLYGNGLTITLNELSGPIFDTVSGEIRDLNISGTLNTAWFAYDTKSMLCNLNTGYICNCKYRLKGAVPVADSLLGTGAPDCFDYCGYEWWDNGWVFYNGVNLPPLFIEETPPAPSYPETGYDATDFTQTKFYQISDVQWNAPLESSEPLGLTVTGGMSIDYTCTGTEFLKLKNIQGGSSITADIYLYTSEDDTTGTFKERYTIEAVTKYGIKTNTPFLFTGQGLNHYNSLTADEASPYRMNSEKIICNPTNIGAVQTAINESLGGLVSLSSADDVLALMNDTSDEKYTKRYAVLQDITVTELSKSLFEKQFNGYFDGQNHTIAVGTGKAPLFKDIGASGEVCNISLAGDFSTYTEPYRDFGVICSNNYGKLHDCTFNGTAPSSTSIGTVSVFGYQAPGSTYSNNTNSSSAADTSDMYQITMIPITGATVSSSIGSGAFESASTESVTVGNFLIAEAEVTYEQWREVYEWAASNGYTFNKSGQPGDKGSEGATPSVDTKTVPVTNITYSDILVWCNAASEKQGLAPVYYVNGTTGTGFQDSSKILRNATTSFSLAAASNPAADGYRLPEQKEWEYAARGGNPDDTTAWNYTYAGTDDPQGYAVQFNLTDANGNTCSQIVSVKTLIPNTAGLYDMSGNAGEYFYPMGSGSSCYHSSSRNSSKNSLSVDYVTSTTTRGVYDGFRVVRGAQSGGNTFISMVNVPGREVDVSTASVDSVFYNASSTPITLNAFKIAETEVTYAQWCEVYDWARDNGYSFAQTGQPGNNGEGQSLTDANGSQPATNMSWRDVIVWCNAASEYEGLVPVYYENGTVAFSSSNVIREAETSSVKSAGQGKADTITVNPDANGYRLPTEAEWEYAARGGNPSDSTNWNYMYAGSDTCSDVAKRDYSTTFVKSLTENSLGLFDMCGNAGEFVWKKNSSYPDYRYYRGGSCNSSESYCTITSYSFVDYQTSRNTDLGFRVVTGGAGNFGNL